jgi:peptide deformylase
MINFHKMVLPVYTVGAPVLSVPAAPIAEITSSVRELAEQMIETMFVFDGIGLAAPQVGIGMRMVAFGFAQEKPAHVTLSPGEELLLPQMPLVVINPQIIMVTKECCLREEGCLSVPEIYAKVERPIDIVFQGQTIDGSNFTVECQGLLARCIQHEIDHLDGQLFINKVSPEELTRIKPQIDELLRHGKENNYIKRNP